MPNHIHLIWELTKPHKLSNVQRDFMKYTAQQILIKMRELEPDLAEELRVDAKDRVYQFWERNPLSTELYTTEMIFQKFDYIHNNPCIGKWMLADEPINYKYSSAKFYEAEFSEFDFLNNISAAAY